MHCENCEINYPENRTICSKCGTMLASGSSCKYTLSDMERQKIIAEEKLRESVRPKPQTSLLTSLINGILLIGGLFWLFGMLIK